MLGCTEEYQKIKVDIIRSCVWWEKENKKVSY